MKNKEGRKTVKKDAKERKKEEEKRKRKGKRRESLSLIAREIKKRKECK